MYTTNIQNLQNIHKSHNVNTLELSARFQKVFHSLKAMRKKHRLLLYVTKYVAEKCMRRCLKNTMNVT